MRGALLGVLAVCLWIPPAATADPITVTSGNLSFPSPSDFTGFQLFGSGFAAVGSGAPSAPFAEFHAGTVDLSGRYAIAPFARELGAITVGATTQPGYVGVDLDVTAQPFLVPDLSGRQTFSTMFTAMGLVSLFSAQGDQLFSQAVNGSGTLFIDGSNFGNGRYATHLEALEFSPAASPTPEPGSLLLLGSGLAAVWRARRARLHCETN